MRKTVFSITLVAVASLVGCSKAPRTSDGPVDTTLPANTTAIGGVSDAADTDADLNAAANEAISDVANASAGLSNAADQGAMPDQSIGSINSYDAPPQIAPAENPYSGADGANIQ